MDTSLDDPISLDATRASVLLDALGGTVAVSRMTFTSTSTVHSWRLNGMTKSRFDHVRLAAARRGKADDLDRALDAVAALDRDPELPFEAVSA